MGKRSTFARMKNDLYPTTDPRAIPPLLGHLPPAARYCEPCAGGGTLIGLLAAAGLECVMAWDIEPGAVAIWEGDARTIVAGNQLFDFYITNPPWTRELLHAIILNLAAQRPTWLLFDADWMHTKQACSFLPLLRKVVSVGRLKWMPGTRHSGKDNCCWYLFDANGQGETIFIGRGQ